MSKKARTLNKEYLETMQKAAPASGLGRVRILWWDNFLSEIERSGPLDALDRLDLCMDVSREKFTQMAVEYAKSKNLEADSAKLVQLQNQFLKSNTGKMFERFVGLAVAHVLWSLDSDYCILPLKKEFLNRSHLLRGGEGLKVRVGAGSSVLTTKIDADLFMFNPSRAKQPVYLVSVKSTLKDRFHNVPFWNLLRLCAVSDDFPNVAPIDKVALQQLKYVAICTDLAEEQPDFASLKGPRNLLQVDARLLDGAYVTSSKAKGVHVSNDHLGPDRQASFNLLSSLVRDIT